MFFKFMYNYKLQFVSQFEIKVSSSCVVRGERGRAFLSPLNDPLGEVSFPYLRSAGQANGAPFSMLPRYFYQRAGLRWRSDCRSNRKSTPPFAPS